jgi:hypothetical protein
VEFDDLDVGWGGASLAEQAIRCCFGHVVPDLRVKEIVYESGQLIRCDLLI